MVYSVSICSRERLAVYSRGTRHMSTTAENPTRKIASVNPATGELLREYECASDQDVRAAVTRARAAQAAWERSGVHGRVEVLRKFQTLLLQRKRQVAECITAEAGKPTAEALATEVLVVLDAARFLIEHAYRLLRSESVPHGNVATRLKRGRLIREPYGVMGIISPWNYPFSIPATETLAALVTGNAVVLKPSELTSGCGIELMSLLHAAGVPKAVFQVVVGAGNTGMALVGSEINKLVFTGSLATGKGIAAAAAQRLLPVVLELGGKDPMIVLEDADVDVTSSAAVWGAFVNAGQACLSIERCYVHRRIYESFLAACVEKTQKLRIGNGLDPATDVGPMIRERQVRVVEAHVENAKLHGARLLAGGTRLPELGSNFYAPTILADVNHAMQIMREETFGPVLPVMVFDSEEQAVILANDTEYGLAASVWTRNRDRGERLARQIRAGTVMVNDAVSCFGISEAPHGGVKASGIGRTHGKFGVDEMVWLKYVDVDLTPGMKKPWWYGYGGNFRQQIEGFLDLQFARGLRTKVRGALSAIGMLSRRRL
jgi:acyl-CoA reductase-like NAD-dependent aldehyde dehydrogenase